MRDAWERLRETAAGFGEQRIYASHSSIMFSRKACYFFVRPRPKRLEICIFLGRTVKSPLVRQVTPSSKTKIAHVLHIVHRDQVEAPLADWLREAYEQSPTLSARPTTKVAPARKAPAKNTKAAAKKTGATKTKGGKAATRKKR